jgi:uncharacterized membrane protein
MVAWVVFLDTDKVISRARFGGLEIMRNAVMFILAINILLYVSVFLDVPILRQCVGFVFLTFLPGFVILRALGMKTDSVAVDFSLSVAVSVAFVMFIGLLVNTLYPLLGISAPLSTLPLMITTSALTLAIFIFSQIRGIGIGSNKYSQLLHAEIDTKGAILCVVSILLLSLSIVGALHHSVFLLVSAIAGTAAIFATSIFLYKRIPSCYYTFALFVVSLSLLLQTSLLTRHIMGWWDIFGEYNVYESVRAAGKWVSPGIVLSHDAISNLNSVLSVTILPTAYSAVLNLNGELIFKIIYPFIFCFVPIFLFKTYAMQLGKIAALLSVFFFIADPINFYGLGSLSLAREMITYLFLSAMIFCFVKQDLDLWTRRVLVIIFSAGLAVSHYSLAFLYVFLVVFVYVAMRIAGKKDALLNLALVLCIVGITFSWYMYVATPPLNSLADAFQNVASRLSTDLFNPKNRVDQGMTVLSPTSQAMSLIGQIQKVIIYITEFFVAVGVIILSIKPKEFKFHPGFRWMAICAAFILLVCIAVPNVAPLLNFSRFYRYTMIFLAPLFILGGVYFLGLFRKILKHSPARPRFVFRDFRLFLLTFILVVFFLFRSSSVNTVAGGLPSSYPLDFDRWITESSGAHALAFWRVIGSVYDVYIPEQDLSSATWLASRIGGNYSVYADNGMVTTLIDYTTLNPQSIYYIMNETQSKPGSYIYLRTLNAQVGIIASPEGFFNLSDLYPSPSQNCRIYSDGGSDVYFVP